jgi:GDP-L-fucose synthase
MMDAAAKIYVAGHRGMVGSALVRRLQQAGYTNILARTHAELDLLDQAATHAFLAQERPDFIFIAAAIVGGIQANNTLRADFIYRNLMVEANLIHGAWLAGIRRLCFLGSSCIYPRDCPQPIREDYLLTGPLEQTNEPYAIAKIAGIKLCESFNRQYGTQYFSAMPTNLYGPGDNFDLGSSHVMPALIRKAHEAKLASADQIVMWGTGTPRREFLHCDDCADALVFLLKTYSGAEHINVGSGEDVSIRELTELVCQVVGFKGAIVSDSSKPDGTPRKLMSANKLQGMGWSPKIDLAEGIAQTYRWYQETYATTGD